MNASEGKLALLIRWVNLIKEQIYLSVFSNLVRRFHIEKFRCIGKEPECLAF